MTNSKNKPRHEVWDDGNEIWRLPNDKRGKRHQDNDVPALISPNGTEVYHKNGTLFRKYGPTIKHPDGYELWSTSKNYHWHREDGATAILPNGKRKYYINGKPVSYDEFREQQINRS